MIKIKLYSKILDKKGQYKPIIVEFPISHHDLILAYAKARIYSPDDCGIMLNKDKYPKIVSQIKHLPQNGYIINDLNYFTKQLDKMDVASIRNLEKALNITPVENYKDLIHLTETLIPPKLTRKDDDILFTDEAQTNEDWIFSLRMSKVDDNGKELTAYAGLPFDEDMLDLRNFGYKLTGVETTISAFDGLFDGITDVDMLNELTGKIKGMGDADFVKYMCRCIYIPPQPHKRT